MTSKVKPRICRTNEINIPIDTEECVLWLNPVQSIDDIKNPTRDYAWITPDNTVYVFNGHKIVPIFSTNDSHIKWGHVDGDIKDQKDLYEILLKTVNGVKQNGTELPKDIEQKVNVSVPIMHIKVNNTEVEPNNYTVNIDLTTYAKTSDIPTKLSQLANDTGYLTPETEDVPIKTITLNGALLNPDEHKNVSINIRTLKSVSTTYQASESDTNIPTGTWNTTIPKLDAQFQHLWTKIVYTYSDGSTETSYTVATTHSGIQIGGRNLIRGSGKLTEDYVPANGDTHSTISEDGVFGNKAVVTTFPWSGAVIHFQNIINRENIQIGDELTVSIYVKAESETEQKLSFKAYRVGVNNGVNFGIVTCPPNTWIKISKSFTFADDKNGSDDYNTARIECGTSLSGGVTPCPVWFSSPKIERGNVPTDWTPAPEDLEAYTDSKVTEINNSLSTYAKKTDVPTKVSQLTNDSGYLTKTVRIFKGTTEDGYKNTDWVDGDLYVQYE